MSLRRHRRQAQAAAGRLQARQVRLAEQTQFLRKAFAHHRSILIVAGGLVAGWMIGRRRLRRSAQVMASLASLALGMMRSPIMPLALSALSSRWLRSARAPSGARDPQG